MNIYQYDYAGLYVGSGIADESPLEPGVFLLPARSTDIAPPEIWPEDKWPRFNGQSWDLVTKINPEEHTSAEQKLAEFLKNNPDVMELIK